ncbi:MAG: hypothetical protein LH631_14885 [Alkalinema sp. CAN_BIN05]|nr:hypothetical protein [Alkalinema sp. CAN_BIN05]
MLNLNGQFRQILPRRDAWIDQIWVTGLVVSRTIDHLGVDYAPTDSRENHTKFDPKVS